MPAAESGRPIAARATSRRDSEPAAAAPTAAEQAVADALGQAWTGAHGHASSDGARQQPPASGEPETRRRGWTVATPHEGKQHVRADEARLRAGGSEARGEIALDGTVIPTTGSGPEGADLIDRLARTRVGTAAWNQPRGRGRVGQEGAGQAHFPGAKGVDDGGHKNLCD